MSLIRFWTPFPALLLLTLLCSLFVSVDAASAANKCKFIDISSAREICLISPGDAPYETLGSEQDCFSICQDATRIECKYDEDQSDEGFGGRRIAGCTGKQSTRDASLYGEDWAGYRVYASEVRKDIQCMTQITTQHPECLSLGAQVDNILSSITGGGSANGGFPTAECKQKYDACVGAEDGPAHTFNTPADCNQIFAAEAHPDCDGLPDTVPPGESGETKQLCVQRKHAECLANCPTCGGSDAGGDPVRKAPDNYKGPIPNCAFTYQGCRNVNQLLELFVNIAQFLFGILGSLALIFFIYGGMTIILSLGNSERVKKGRDILVAAVVGLLISFSAYLLIGFLIQTLGVSSEFDFRKVEAPTQEAPFV